MAIFSTSISGIAQQVSAINPDAITRGTQSPYVQHSYEKLTECPCDSLNRFSEHGGAIRKAYENAVVTAIGTFYPHRDALLSNKINVVVVGAGGLLQEAFWLQKLYNSKVQPSELSLHLVDIEYAAGDQRLENFANYAPSKIVPGGATLNVYGWNSWQALKQARITPHLVIGMDTEGATPEGTKYQWALQQGDLEKVLIVKWGLQDKKLQFKLYSRRGASERLEEKTCDNHVEAAARIEAAGVLGSG